MSLEHNQGPLVSHQREQENPRKNVQALVTHANILIDFDLLS
jgi:hypothetical protein